MFKKNRCIPHILVSIIGCDFRVCGLTRDGKNYSANISCGKYGISCSIPSKPTKLLLTDHMPSMLSIQVQDIGTGKQMSVSIPVNVFAEKAGHFLDIWVPVSETNIIMHQLPEKIPLQIPMGGCGGFLRLGLQYISDEVIKQRPSELSTKTEQLFRQKVSLLSQGVVFSPGTSIMDAKDEKKHEIPSCKSFPHPHHGYHVNEASKAHLNQTQMFAENYPIKNQSFSFSYGDIRANQLPMYPFNRLHNVLSQSTIHSNSLLQSRMAALLPPPMRIPTNTVMPQVQRATSGFQDNRSYEQLAHTVPLPQNDIHHSFHNQCTRSHAEGVQINVSPCLPHISNRSHSHLCRQDTPTPPRDVRIPNHRLDSIHAASIHTAKHPTIYGGHVNSEVKVQHVEEKKAITTFRPMSASVIYESKLGSQHTSLSPPPSMSILESNNSPIPIGPLIQSNTHSTDTLRSTNVLKNGILEDVRVSLEAQMHEGFEKFKSLSDLNLKLQASLNVLLENIEEKNSMIEDMRTEWKKEKASWRQESDNQIKLLHEDINLLTIELKEAKNEVVEHRKNRQVAISQLAQSSKDMRNACEILEKRYLKVKEEKKKLEADQQKEKSIMTTKWELWKAHTDPGNMLLMDQVCMMSEDVMSFHNY